jgi:phosphinothricin acetyltransferase
MHGSNSGISTTGDVTIRPASSADLAEINTISDYYVAHSTCVWTTQPCSEAERKAWFEAQGRSMPVLVAEYPGRVVGWGALGSFRAASWEVCGMHDTSGPAR